MHQLPKPFYQDEYATIYNADCRDILPLLTDIDLVLTSPPYNVGMEYEEIIPWQDYYLFMKQWLSDSLLCLKDGGVLAVNLPKEVKNKTWQIEKYGRRVEKIGERVDLMCEDIGFLPREAIIWAKGNEGEPIASSYKMGADNNIYMRTTCEMILMHSKNRYHYDGGTGQRGKDVVPWLEETKDIWWINSSRRNGHPCPWPREIPHRLISMFTIPRKHIPVVVDPFMGSGETLVVAKGLKRKCIGIEKELKYCRMAANQLKQIELNFKNLQSEQIT
jgi:site-specific DNA-methyltransferase (adenine-specific)